VTKACDANGTRAAKTPRPKRLHTTATRRPIARNGDVTKDKRSDGLPAACAVGDHPSCRGWTAPALEEQPTNPRNKSVIALVDEWQASQLMLVRNR